MKTAILILLEVLAAIFALFVAVVDWSAFFSAFGAFLLVILPAVAAFVLQLRQIHQKVKENADETKYLRVHINSRMDQLLATTGAKERAEGKAEGKAEGATDALALKAEDRAYRDKKHEAR
jgi:hypothetical protein